MDYPLLPHRAGALRDLPKTLSVAPLRNPEELRTFYAPELNQVRGEDKVKRLALALKQSHGSAYYKSFLYGHSGTGKSTELTRLTQEVARLYRPVRFSALREFDPINVKAFDVLALMLIKVSEQAAAPPERGGLGWRPPEELVQRIWAWFGDETATITKDTAVQAIAEAGLGLDADSWWGKLFGLYAKLKGEMKFASQRKEVWIEYRLTRLADLIDLLNQFLRACSEASRAAEGREWLFLGEDFEKLLRPDLPEELFIRYANAFSSLDAHLIFTIPVDLAYSQSARLPFAVEAIPDVPVYDAHHQRQEAGHRALTRLLERRLDTAVFEPGQMERLIVASGGYLRDLFALIQDAAYNALLSEPESPTIRREDVTKAIIKQRQRILLRLGVDPYAREPVSYPEKVQRLLAIYRRDPPARVPDPVLYELLRARAVQEFNGEGRFGIAPLVVDILKQQGDLPADAPGGSI
jgi:hypothetical protein